MGGGLGRDNLLRLPQAVFNLKWWFEEQVHFGGGGEWDKVIGILGNALQ